MVEGCDMAGLNENQKAFARLLAAGVTQSAAYRQVFGDKGKSAAAIRSAASRLATDVNVVSFVATLSQAADRRAVMDRQERMERLSAAVEDCQRKGRYGEMVRNIAELNRMDGAYEPEKLEVSGVLGVGAVVAALQARGQRPPVC